MAVLAVALVAVAGLGGAVQVAVWEHSGSASACFPQSRSRRSSRSSSRSRHCVVIAGNLAMGAAIDRYGLFGLDRIALHWPRILGLVLFGVGAALSLKN